MHYRFLFALIPVLFSGCASPITPAGPDTYMIATTSVGLVTGSAPKAKAYRLASKWCTDRGLVMVPVSTDSRDTEIGGRYAGAELYFRALKPGDPGIHRPSVDKPDHIQRVQVR